MNSTKSKNDAKGKKRKAQNTDPERNKRQKTELSFIVKDETGAGNENSESVFNKLAPKPGRAMTELLIQI